MNRKVLLFAPAAFSLAETSRMVEIAKGVARDPVASQRFEIRFISEGGDFESLIEDNHFRSSGSSRSSPRRRSRTCSPSTTRRSSRRPTPVRR